MLFCSVRLRSCCCCSLPVATFLTILYCFIFYAVSLGLASWGLDKTVSASYDDRELEHYIRCDEEASSGRSYEFRDGNGRVIAKDLSSTPYFCSLGLYFEELKLSRIPRFPVLIVDILIYSFLLLATLIAAVAVCIRNQWLLVPLIGMLCIDIIRGLISTIIIFVYSYGSLIRIAVGIFFLGVQIFHVSLVLVLVAMLQYIYDKKHGIVEQPPAEKWVASGQAAYPTLPSTYAYNSSPQSRREGFYQPHPPSRQHSQAAYSTYDPRYH